MAKKKHTLLIVEDDSSTLSALRFAFAQTGANVLTAATGKEALARLDKGVDLVISDVRMPEMGGMELLERVKKTAPATKVIMLTAYGTIDLAVDAMRKGAFDFMTKPVNLDKLLNVARAALKTRDSEADSPAKTAAYPAIIGKSPALKAMMETIEAVSRSRATVLIQGERGSGKELVARAIHDLGATHNQPFVAVHCAALSESLLESELFGHEKGAFTGASQQKKGRFEMADEGTLFLDEISEINPAIQAKLLRVLQFKEFERVGGTRTIRVNTRVITATNADLAREVAKGRFREDLFDRLNVVVIRVPALRQRKDDIPLLVESFVREFNVTNGKTLTEVTDAAMEMLSAYDWPGNVRQLKNAIERAVIFSRGDSIGAEDIRASLESNPIPEEGSRLSVKDNEKELIRKALDESGGNVTQAAVMLGVSRRTLHRKINKLGL